MKKNEIIKEKNNEVLEKKSHLFIFLVIGLIIGGLFGLVFVFKSNGIKSQLDNLLTSGIQEVIFFERDNDYKSEYVKEVLDNDLKEQGIIYTTINITNATEKEIQYIKEKLHLVGEDFSVYLMVVNGNDNVTSISTNEVDKDTIMLYFARKLLLNDNDSVLNEHYYQLGKKAYEEGILGEAKRNLDKEDKSYKDTATILADKNFYLIGNNNGYNDFTYRIENISMNGYNLIYTFSYNGGYSSETPDSISIFKWECQGAYNCLYTNGESTFYDAKTIDDKIYIKSKGSNSYDKYYTIEKITKDTLKLKEIKYTFKKED